MQSRARRLVGALGVLFFASNALASGGGGKAGNGGTGVAGKFVAYYVSTLRQIEASHPGQDTISVKTATGEVHVEMERLWKAAQGAVKVYRAHSALFDIRTGERVEAINDCHAAPANIFVDSKQLKHSEDPRLLALHEFLGAVYCEDLDWGYPVSTALLNPNPNAIPDLNPGNPGALRIIETAKARSLDQQKGRLALEAKVFYESLSGNLVGRVKAAQCSSNPDELLTKMPSCQFTYDLDGKTVVLASVPMEQDYASFEGVSLFHFVSEQAYLVSGVPAPSSHPLSVSDPARLHQIFYDLFIKGAPGLDPDKLSDVSCESTEEKNEVSCEAFFDTGGRSSGSVRVWYEVKDEVVLKLNRYDTEPGC